MTEAANSPANSQPNHELHFAEPGETSRYASEPSAAEDELAVPDDWEPIPPDSNYKSGGYRLYRYRGMTTNSVHLEWGFLQQLRQFQARPSDVIVVSFPKSGTSWLQEIVWQVTHHDELANSGRSGVPLDVRFPLLDALPPKDMVPLEKMTGRRFIKAHLHYHMLPESVRASGAKVMYIIRDARDVCVSFYHFSRMLNIYKYRGTFAEFRDSFMRGEVVYGPYREHVKGYLEHSNTVLCLTYEQLHQDRASVVRKVAGFLGVSLTDDDVDSIVRNTSFESMKANPDTNFRQWEATGVVPGTEEGTFMRKGVVGDWKNYFTEEENEGFMKWRNQEVALL